MMVYSFDLFDTALLRKVFSPKDVYYFVGRELVSRGGWSRDIESWVSIRVSSEAAARAATREQEITFSDIYEQMLACHGFVYGELAMEIEKKFEKSLIIPNDEVVQRIVMLVKNGERVCYTSDMYLPADFIKELISQAGMPDCPLFLSSDFLLTKSSGDLFLKLAEYYSVSVNEIIHLGDNYFSDYKVPSEMGVSATHYSASQPTDFEKRAYSRLLVTDRVFSSFIVGGIKNTRIAATEKFNSSSFVTEILCGVGAILHFGFACWVAREAKKEQLDKVFFLARDACLPSRLYQVIKEKYVDLPDGDYLYVSRQSVHAPSLACGVTEGDFDWIFSITKDMTFEDWLFQFGLKYFDDFNEEERARLGFPEKDKIINETNIGSCKELLLNDLFMDKVKSCSSRNVKLVGRYFSSFGVDRLGSFGVVDIGWSGRLQKSISRILDFNGVNASILGLYLGLKNIQDNKHGVLRSWLFDIPSGLSPEIGSHAQIYELIFSAPHHTTYGYQVDVGGVVPVFAKSDPSYQLWESLIFFHHRFESVCRDVILFFEDEYLEDIRSFAVNEVQGLFFNPTSEQVQALSVLDFGSDQRNTGKERIVYEIGFLHTLLIFLKIKKKIGGSHWVSGQVVYSCGYFGHMLNTGALMLKKILGI